ncbi:MAG: EAL domain-containing protein, partial [Actinomycetota bacterium]|nr:EAL domain-containing protein [Actinomycetota bacterium]
PDAPPLDARRVNAERLDAEPLDAEPLDSEPLDSEPLDAEPSGPGSVDAEPPGREPGGERHRRPLTLAVAALRWTLLGGVGLLVLAHLVREPGQVVVWLDVWVFHIVMAAAVALVGLRPALQRTDRAAWSLLALGMGLWLVGDLCWEIVIEPLGDDAPSPNVADFWYLPFYPLSAGALLRLAARRAGGASRALWLDGLVAGLGAAAVAALAFGAIKGDTGSAGDVLVDLVYPVADMVLLAVTLAVLAAQAWRLTPLWSYLSAGLLLITVADLNFLLSEAKGTYEQGVPADLGWPVGFALMALAAWQPVIRAWETRSGPALVVPSVVTAVSVGVLVAAADGDLPHLAVVLAAAALLGGAARTALAFRELRSLVEARRLAVTDELTGLGNRRMLQARLADELARRRPGDTLAVLLLDLDRFKEINDALGHHVGDDLLRAVGPRLGQVLRDDDALTRLGGDEFALLLGPGTDAAQAQALAARVRDALRRPFELDGVQLHLDVSIGISLCPDHALTAAGLLQCADVAMYEAKQARSGYALYAPERDRHDRNRLQTIAQLHTAAEAGQLVCHYQPQCDLATGRIVGAEALVRWEHPERGLLEPDEFLGLAAQVGLMPQLTRRVLSMALQDCAEWRKSGSELSVSVNLSGLALDAALPGEVARMLRRTGVPAGHLVLEVTEDVMLVHAARAADVVAQLQTLGVRLSMDDYGTGYSSLTRLRTLPVHELKLDRSYIAGLGSDERDAAIVSSTVALAHALGLTVVAEGVESMDDWQSLRGLSCDRAQGHLLSPPLSPPRFAAWLAARQGGALAGLGR